mmetsp:Transcript_9604/g.35968  ORF Transcript_9604/g.35968 Transcript_9604/m.35968 type:complete len:163 (-) Transcript_9604:90-578(-)|eukprot:scaffold172_cov254-Pinguiococcus_pyrenoidosus.AAC.9
MLLQIQLNLLSPRRGSSWCVRRRYSDFAKLAKAIRAASREDPEFAKALQEGSTRPAKESVKKVLQWLPPKTVAPCVKEAFLTKRQEALAKFTGASRLPACGSTETPWLMFLIPCLLECDRGSAFASRGHEIGRGPVVFGPSPCPRRRRLEVSADALRLLQRE